MTQNVSARVIDGGSGTDTLNLAAGGNTTWAALVAVAIRLRRWREDA